MQLTTVQVKARSDLSGVRWVGAERRQRRAALGPLWPSHGRPPVRPVLERSLEAEAREGAAGGS